MGIILHTASTFVSYDRVWDARRVIVHTQQCTGKPLGNRQVKSQFFIIHIKWIVLIYSHTCKYLHHTINAFFLLL